MVTGISRPASLFMAEGARLRWLRARATVNGADGSGNVNEGNTPV